MEYLIQFAAGSGALVRECLAGAVGPVQVTYEDDSALLQLAESQTSSVGLSCSFESLIVPANTLSPSSTESRGRSPRSSASRARVSRSSWVSMTTVSTCGMTYGENSFPLRILCKLISHAF